MKTINLLLTLTLALPFSLAAQTFTERAKEAYLKTDKNFDIDCFYSENRSFKLITPNGSTVKGSDSISRNFTIESEGKKVPMSFTVDRINRKFEYRVLFDQKHTSQGKLSKREFYIMPIQDKAFAAEFETSKIYCQVNFAYAAPFELTDGDYHINVHPHTIYDWQYRIKDPIESYLNNNAYTSLILLEAGNYRGNLVDINDFLDGVDYKLPPSNYESDLQNVPLNIPFIVSPAGNNRFDFKVKSEINITFTGGNHNYCIWNGTRHVLEGLMNSKSTAKVNFYYDTKSTVAQVRGVEGMKINFSRKDVSKSNLLKDLLSRKEIQATYHAGYIDYFKGYLAREYAGMYKTYTIHYKAEGYNTTVVLQGTGLRDLVITMNYL